MTSVQNIAGILAREINGLLERAHFQRSNGPAEITPAAAAALAQTVLNAANTVQHLAAGQTVIDANSYVMRYAVACLTKKAGGTLTIRAEELREIQEMVESGGADLDYVFTDDGACTFTLTRAVQTPGFRLS